MNVRLGLCVWFFVAFAGVFSCAEIGPKDSIDTAKGGSSDTTDSGVETSPFPTDESTGAGTEASTATSSGAQSTETVGSDSGDSTDSSSATDSDASASASSTEGVGTDSESGTAQASDSETGTGSCLPDCAGKCPNADDGCGGQCETNDCPTMCCFGQCCGPHDKCVGGACECVPDCNGKTCGDNGCGGSCGTCQRPDDFCFGDSIVHYYDPPCESGNCSYPSLTYDCPEDCGFDLYGKAVCMNVGTSGVVDGANASGVNGWACDRDAPWASIDVHLYFDSVPGDADAIVRVVQANLPSEPGVADACGGGEAHRFSYAFPGELVDLLGPGVHQVWAFGIDTSGAGDHNYQLSNCPASFTLP